MKRAAVLIALFFIITSFLPLISAEIIILQEPSSVYNLGDIISIPIKITSLTEIGNPFTISLICNGAETEVQREYVIIESGGEIEKNPPIPLIRNFVGDLKGSCRLKYLFGSELKLSDEFKISDLININITSQQKDFAPEEEITIDGNAKKENGKEANGFVKMEIISGNISEGVSASNTIKNGLFTLKFTLPMDTASGDYLLKMSVYEKDSNGETTNNGVADYRIFIKQVPANLEILVENAEIEPEATLKTKAVLHDQTGQSIDSTALITILNNKNKVMEEKELKTDEFLEFTIPKGELPGQWTIKAKSNGLSSDAAVRIKEQERISTDIIGNTLIVTNTGNVLYNKSVLIKIGENPVNIDVNLDVGKYQRYSLTAPDGEYNVNVVVGGESNLNKDVLLTGKTIDVKENKFAFGNNTIIWIAIIILLAFVGMILFKRWRKKNFFGYIPREGKRPSPAEFRDETIQLKKGSSLTTKNKAELELSIKGDQQDISLVCLKIKNLDKLKESKTDYAKVLDSLAEAVEEQKGYIYGASENIFFIYAPIKTKTFRNEKTALNFSQKIAETIESYNKMAKEKINAGISLTYGTIIANAQGSVLKFMALGNLMNIAKKLASSSDNEVLLSDKIREKLGAEIKTNKKDIGSGISAYTIKEIRNDERSQEFIRRFMDRMQKGQ